MRRRASVRHTFSKDTRSEEKQQ
ncbi:hypothetical protein CGLO_02387 [Colletotrichum gloeosporioides Cg-14]|uniref:Uncharacterized protein n=1 Tax=Colletotrichum gloeosporioides (strain Cg-14) TaxID=1237896 RepID=T0KYC2_COLGC|nr:hypothetical protein CGLO_02387 [Colletotrichum gloeosporioides Cg-14]